MTSVKYFLFKDQISTLSTKHSNAKSTYLFLDKKLAVRFEVANLILVSVYDKYLPFPIAMSQNFN